MGSKGSNTTQTTQQQSYTPSPYISQAGQQAITGAEAAAAQPFQMPVAPVAQFQPFQQMAFGETLGMQGMAQPYFNMGTNYLQGSAAPITGQDVSQYYNPMASNVFNQMQNIFGQQMRETTGNLTQAAGGVGADRIAVGQANLANQQGLAAGQTAANLYAQALQAAQQQKQMEAGAGYGIAQMGPAAQTAQLQGIGALGAAGSQQQQLAQAQLNAMYQQQLAQIAYPFQTAQYLAGITGGLAPAMGYTTYGTGTQTTPSPTALAQGLGVGVGALGLYGGLGGTFSNPFASNPMVPGATQVVGGAGTQAVPTFFAEGGEVIPFPKTGSNEYLIWDENVDRAVQKHIAKQNPSQAATRATLSRALGMTGNVIPFNPFDPRSPSSGGNLTPVFQSGGGTTIGTTIDLPPSDYSDLSPDIADQLRQAERDIYTRQNTNNNSNIIVSPNIRPIGRTGRESIDASGLIHGFQSGGATEDDSIPPVPGVALPKTGGLSPIPYTPIATHPFMNAKLDLSPHTQQQQSGSGLGDVLKTAIGIGKMFPIARGGAVNPFDVGQPFQGGGTPEEIDATDLGPVDVTPASPEQKRDDATALALASGEPRSTVPNQYPPQFNQPSVTNPLAYAPTQTQTRNPMSVPVTNADMNIGQYMLPAADRPYPDALQRDWGQNLVRSPWMALVAAGAQMAQTRGPIGSVIGAGMGAGAKELEGQRKELRSEQEINMKAQQLHQQAIDNLNEYQRMKPYQAGELDVARKRLELEQYHAPIMSPFGDYAVALPKNPQTHKPLYYPLNNETGQPDTSKPQSMPPIESAPPAHISIAPVGGKMVTGDPTSMISPPDVGSAAHRDDTISQTLFDPRARQSERANATIVSRQVAKEVETSTALDTRAKSMKRDLDVISNFVNDPSTNGKLAALLTPGITGAERQKIINAYSTWANATKSAPKIPDEVVAAVNALGKDSVLGGFRNITAEGLSAREAQPIIQAAMGAMPSFALPEQSSRLLISAMESAAQRQQDRLAFLADYRRKNGGFTTGWEAAFNNQFPTSMYVARAAYSVIPEEKRREIPQAVQELRQYRDAVAKAEQSGDTTAANQARQIFLKGRAAFDRRYGGLSNYFMFGTM